MCDPFACFFCFSDAPHDDDPRKGFSNTWQIKMSEAPCKNPGWFCYGCLCPCCSHYQLRTMALEHDMSKYQCCQGYVSCCCIQGGKMNEQSCPELCLCLESCCCHSCALSATRFYIMDTHNLVSDPCDNRIIRFNNFMQCLSCILNCLAIFISELRQAADIVELIARIVYYITAGCMMGQMQYELTHSPTMGAGAPKVEGMERSV